MKTKRLSGLVVIFGAGQLLAKMEGNENGFYHEGRIITVLHSEQGWAKCSLPSVLG